MLAFLGTTVLLWAGRLPRLTRRGKELLSRVRLSVANWAPASDQPERLAGYRGDTGPGGDRLPGDRRVPPRIGVEAAHARNLSKGRMEAAVAASAAGRRWRRQRWRGRGRRRRGRWRGRGLWRGVWRRVWRVWWMKTAAMGERDPWINTLPALGVGLGFREPFRSEVFFHRDRIDFLEIIADHYLDVSAGKLQELEMLADHFTLIPHGLSLSLGSATVYTRPDGELVRRIDPPWWSEHIAFTRAGGSRAGAPDARSLFAARRSISSRPILRRFRGSWTCP